MIVIFFYSFINIPKFGIFTINLMIKDTILEKLSFILEQDKKDEILKADGAILPGVGSFADAMDCMRKSGADKAVLEFVQTGKAFLGICLGLQLLFDGSEESPGVQGLGLLKGSVTKIPNQNNTLKIPHMGWNSLDILKHDGIFKNIPQNSYVYFVHSYYLKAENEDIVAASTPKKAVKSACRF